MLIRSSLTALALLLAAPALAQTTPAPAPAPAAEPADAAADAAAPAEAAADENILPDIYLGAESAPLTIHEYASFTCGHCAAFHAEGWPKLKAEYVDTGKVRFAQRDVYFDQVGLWAGILARCGGEDKYYAVSDLLFDEQKSWLASGGEEIAANLRKIGLKAGMTEEQMNACWDNQAQVEKLVATFQKNATADEIDATPTFVIGGEKVPNQDWEKLKAIIDQKLAASPAPTGEAPAEAAADAAADTAAEAEKTE